MRSVAVPQLALAVRQRADLAGQENAFGSNAGLNITDVEMLTMLNASFSEFWDLQIECYGDNYQWSVYNLPIAQGVYQYQMPFDFYKEFGVDFSLDNTGVNWATVRPYTLRDRNQFSFPLQTALAYQGWQNIRWQMQGQILNFLPQLGPLPGLVRLLYAPACPLLCATLPAAWVHNTVTAQNALIYASVTTNGATANQVYMALNAGTTGGSAPTWVVPGTVQDGGVLWAYQGPLSLYATTLDGINGGDDYVVLDCAIKAGIKQEMDVSAFGAQKAALTERLRVMLKNRQAGDPMVISGGFGTAEGGPGAGFGFGTGAGGGWGFD